MVRPEWDVRRLTRMGSWIPCLCGSLVHANLYCGAGVFRLIRDDEWDAVANTDATPEREDYSRLFRDSREVFRCSNCSRLIVYWDRQGGLPTYYRVETPPNEKPDA